METTLDNLLSLYWPKDIDDWTQIEAALGDGLDDLARGDVQRALNNYVVFSGSEVEVGIYSSEGLRGSLKADGTTRQASPLLTFRRAMHNLFVAWNALRSSDAAKAVADFDDKSEHGDYPTLEETIAHLQANAVLLRVWLESHRERREWSAFEVLVLRLSEIFESVKGRPAPMSNTPYDAFASFVEAVEGRASIPREPEPGLRSGGPDAADAEEKAAAAFAQKVYRAQCAIRDRQAPG